MSQGKIKAIKIGNQWRYKKSDIENYFSHGTDFSKQPARDNVADRRTHPRINCSIQSDIRVIIPQKKEITTQARILNISEGGVFLENCSNEQGFINIKNDDPINLNFNINNNKKLELDGRVLRTSQEGIAVKFKKIHHDKRKLIKQYETNYPKDTLGYIEGCEVLPQKRRNHCDTENETYERFFENSEKSGGLLRPLNNIKDFMNAFQWHSDGTPTNGYVELYDIKGMGDVGESEYQRFGIRRKPLPEDLKQIYEHATKVLTAA